MIPRHAARLVRARLKRFPAVALVGPRQCGKTTLAKALGGAYFDLEQPEERVRLDVEWPGLARSTRRVILDEVQAWPEVFPRLRGTIDAHRRRTGRFLLLGSVSPSFMRQVSESLAGRLAVCELRPLLLSELPRRRADALWLLGGYPDGGVLGAPDAYPVWQRSYLELLAGRDLPTWGLPASPQLTMRLFRMLAVSHGNPWNASQIGQGLGITYHTVNSYLDCLEGAFLVRRLPAYHANLRKRLLRAPRVYWRDAGLLHALLDLRDRDALLSHPAVGASWEGWVIEQLLGALATAGQEVDAFYLRTSDGHEIDLLLEREGRLWALEIKLTTSPHPEHVARLAQAADLVDADVRMLVTRASRTAETKGTVITNVSGAIERLSRGHT